MNAARPDRIAVYGAYGHTGRFVLAELRRRGFVPVACGRDAAKLAALAAATGVETRVADVDDPAALDAAFAGTAAVLLCAGPSWTPRHPCSTQRCARASTTSTWRPSSARWPTPSRATPRRGPRA
ncbi:MULTISPECIES: NAD(P)H-binding protein [unclassified Rhodanobacter]|uniref:NAD(P)H-binding protein n=1 Tax=Rhodanobacter humi TaxID=1888173 RepID=A0ABV4AUL5_9GAMM